MQKKNPVIKDYILSSKRRILCENPPPENSLSISILLFEILLYRLFLEQNKDFEGECVPNDIYNEYGDVCAVARTCVDPVDRFDTEYAKDIVHNTRRVDNFVLRT